LNNDGKTPLNLAAEMVSKMEALPEIPANDFAAYIGLRNTHLFLRGVAIEEYVNAVRRNDTVFLERLIQAFPEYINAYVRGKSPLFRAVELGYSEVLASLLTHGANPDCPALIEKNPYPLHIVAKTGDEASTRLLLEAGADTSVVNALGETPLDLANRYARTSIGILLQSKRADPKATEGN